MRFEPSWNTLTENLDKFKFYKIEANEMNTPDAKKIIDAYGSEPQGFPTILIKVNDIFARYMNEDRTPKAIMEFIINLTKDEDLNKYLLDKIKKIEQTGGKNNVDYRNKYKKYKKMYAELAIKYNDLKKLN
jgi:hypothetical protein